MKIFSKLLILPVKFYQKGISPLLPPSCRYYPTCSTYMIQAIEKHGALLGLLMDVPVFYGVILSLEVAMIRLAIILVYVEIKIRKSELT